jgi:hypothetical protein
MPSVPPTPLPASRPARPPAPPEAPVTVRWRSWAESLDVDGTPRPSPPPRRQNTP